MTTYFEETHVLEVRIMARGQMNESREVSSRKRGAISSISQATCHFLWRKFKQRRTITHIT